jgi:hypothetical protein
MNKTLGSPPSLFPLLPSRLPRPPVFSFSLYARASQPLRAGRPLYVLPPPPTLPPSFPPLPPSTPPCFPPTDVLIVELLLLLAPVVASPPRKPPGRSTSGTASLPPSTPPSLPPSFAARKGLVVCAPRHGKEGLCFPPERAEEDARRGGREGGREGGRIGGGCRSDLR